MAKGELEIDPRGLIQDAYAMEIGPADCRTIFLDWLLGRPEGAREAEIAALLDHFGAACPEHPMTAVLRAALQPAEGSPHRRGGRRGRRPA